MKYGTGIMYRYTATHFAWKFSKTFRRKTTVKKFGNIRYVNICKLFRITLKQFTINRQIFKKKL